MQHISPYEISGDIPDYGELDLRLDGVAQFYFQRRDSVAFTEQKSQRVQIQMDHSNADSIR
jgi:hypothetical protein